MKTTVNKFYTYREYTIHITNYYNTNLLRSNCYLSKLEKQYIDFSIDEEDIIEIIPSDLGINFENIDELLLMSIWKINDMSFDLIIEDGNKINNDVDIKEYRKKLREIGLQLLNQIDINR